MNEKEKNITYTRSLILEIIGHNKEKEITRFTNITKSGIYLIYIDNFNDNKILPIYVGQTVNFQQRYREHLENLIEIDGCNSKEYIKNLKIQEYNGNYKYNKIFSYLLDHNCTLENLHMIILEETENLEEKEQYYISKLNSNIYGFNQLKSVTFWVANKKQCYSELTNGQYYPALFNGEYNIKDLFKEYVTKDILNYDIYKNYGYNKFNYFLLCQILNNLDNLLGLNEKELFNKILSDMLKEINLYIVSENLHINNYFDYINYLCEKWNEKNKTRKLIIEKILSNLKNLGISAHDLEKANGQVKKSIIQRLEILAGSKKYNTESSFLSYNTFYDFWEITSDNKFMKHSYNLISDDTLKINFKKEIEELKKILIAIDYFSWEICSVEKIIKNYSYPFGNIFLGNLNFLKLNHLIPNNMFSNCQIVKFISPLKLIENFNENIKIIFCYNNPYNDGLYFKEALPTYFGFIKDNIGYECFIDNKVNVTFHKQDIFMTTINEDIYNNYRIDKNDFNTLKDKIAIFLQNYNSSINIYVLTSGKLTKNIKNDIKCFFDGIYDLSKLNFIDYKHYIIE